MTAIGAHAGRLRLGLASMRPRDAAWLAACACLASWSVYLLAFWPAILSDDSLDQWRQLLTWQLTSYHPPVHTLTNWVVTRIWETPTAVALAQMIVLALLVGRAVHVVVAGGGSRALVAAAVALMVVAPAHGLLAITLWKDIPYACALVWLTWQLVDVARTRGASMERPASRIALVLALAATALYRHNGMAVAIGALLAVGVCLSRQRRAMVVVALATLGLVVGAQAALTRAFALEPIAPILRYQAPIHQLGALAMAGAYDESPADRALLERVLPGEAWRTAYECGNVVPLLHRIDAVAFAERVPAYRDLWWRGVRRAPGAVAAHVGCVTGMIWHPLRRPHAFASLGIASNDMGLTRRPASAALYAAVSRYVALSQRPWLSPLLWGPALYLYVVIACTWLAWRRGGLMFALPFVPSLIHSAVLIAAIPSAEYRLQYPVVIVGTFAPALLSILRRERSA